MYICKYTYTIDYIISTIATGRVLSELPLEAALTFGAGGGVGGDPENMC